MGRAAFTSKFSSPGKTDYAVCDEIIERLRIGHLKDKAITQISGGEQQLVMIARAMVQKPEIIMMDEPTSNLDYGNQALVLEQISQLANEGFGVLMITHSPDQALICADKVVLFNRNKQVSIGKPSEILTEENLRETYGIKVCFTTATQDDGSVLKSCVPCIARKGR